MNTDPQLDRRQIGSLQAQRAPDSVARAGESCHEAVAFALLDWAHPAVLGDELGGGLIHACDGGRHRLALRLPELR